MSAVEITISINPDQLIGYTDSFLATAWHVAQANPAPYGDYAAGDLVEKLAREIVRRFLVKAEPELWHHQGRHASQKWLSMFARYVPPEGVDVAGVEWHNGQWVPNEPNRVREKELLAAAKLIEDEAAGPVSADVAAFAQQTVAALRSRARAVGGDV